MKTIKNLPFLWYYGIIITKYIKDVLFILKKIFISLSSLILVLSLSVSSVSASGFGTDAVEPIRDGGTCSGQKYSYYMTESEIELLFHQKKNYETFGGWASFALGVIGIASTSMAISGASAIFGGATLGSAANGDWVNQAYYKDTGMLLCHDGLQVISYSPNQATYVNVNRYFY